MSDVRRSLLIGQGEKLFQDGDWPSSRGGKPNPYLISQQQSILTPVLNELALTAGMSKLDVAPRGEIAVKIAIHPEFLAKSYFPTSLLKASGLRLIGSRAEDITPREMVYGKPSKRLPSAVLIVAGTEANINKAASLLNSNKTSNAIKEDFCRIESIAPFLPKDRKLGLDMVHFNGWLEVVLHATLGDDDIKQAFFETVHGKGGEVNLERARSIGGLTFMPAYAPTESSFEFIRGIENFTHLRMLRNMPTLSEDPIQFDEPITRNENFAPTLPNSAALDQEISAVIFDGGFTKDLLPWVNSTDAAGVPSKATDFPHGHSVTSAFLFGAIGENQSKVSAPYCNVDHVRILPSTANDIRVADVIDRIIDTLQAARDAGKPYTLANLSLGPRMPIIDDDPHEWTVRLDDFLSLGDLFMTVAAGNDGAHGQELGRIQPPADAVNAFSVGSCDGFHPKAKRAPYSCLGPGRSPGLVKPDAVAFGGTKDMPLRLIDPITGLITRHAGTSYSSPLAMRLAAGVISSVKQHIQPTMLHALLISQAKFNRRNGHDQTEVGWGVLPESPEDILYSADDEVVVMYQGVIAKGQPIRATIPLPAGMPSDASVTIGATFSYRAIVDPAHPVSYTRGGLEVLFQPDGKNSEGFFSASKYDAEQDLRRDALKWETCRHRTKKIGVKKMSDPSFLIRYQGREEGASDDAPLKDNFGKLLPAEQQPSALPFALVIRLKVPGIENLSQRVLNQFKVLSELSLKTQVQT
jgi:hypothetical protein